MKSRANQEKDQVTLENKYAFSGKIKCAFCGRIYSRKTWGQKDNLKVGWNCVSSIKHGKENCPYCKAMKENIINVGSVGNSFDVIRNDSKDSSVLETTKSNYLIIEGEYGVQEYTSDIFIYVL